MRIVRLIVPALLALVLLPAAQTAPQSAPPPPDQDKWGITVTGERPTRNGKPIEMSDWRVAETEHVLVYSKGDQPQLIRIAHNLEKEYFLLSVLLNRVGEPDDTAKLRVMLIGDAADFAAMHLTNLRWQQGPYSQAVPPGRYYDPRDDGAILATTHSDEMFLVKPGQGLLDALDGQTVQKDPNAPPGMTTTVTTPGGGVNDQRVDELSFKFSADGRLYAGFAQHYLMTYFPAAYPRWYLDGFGEMFATMAADKDGVIEFGHTPEGFRKVIDYYGGYPVRDVLSGKYLDANGSTTRWTPYHAWALTHLLFMSEKWKAPLHRYLAAVARGARPGEAARALGDLDALQREFRGYMGAKVEYERYTYPSEMVAQPVVRQLTESQAAILRGRLELGARVEIPPAPPPGADPATARHMTDARKDALAARDAWLRGLRDNAARYPDELAHHLLLAEAECRSGNNAECLTSADQALRLSPENPSALTWKGIAMIELAVAGPAADRAAKLTEARAVIVRANRADTEAPLPLIAYYRSYADAGEPAPDIAVLGLVKASEIVPSAPQTRLLLGEALARRGDVAGTRRALLPVADGAYDSPERPVAKALLASVGKQGGKGDK